MKYTFLALFVIVSVIHLAGSFRDCKAVRNATKGGILFCLTGYYLCAAFPVNRLFLGALGLSWAGDVLLMLGKWGFAAGGVSFMASHVLFGLSYLPLIDLPSVPAVIPCLAGLVYGVAALLLIISLRPGLDGKLSLCLLGYLLINGGMNCLALMLLLSRPGLSAGLIYAGAVLFFVSDCILFLVRFHPEQPVWKKHFLVMLSYVLAEFLLVRGMLPPGP